MPLIPVGFLGVGKTMLLNALLRNHAFAETAGGRDLTLPVPSEVATLFDLGNIAITLDNHSEALKQVALADGVLLTKTDMPRDTTTLADR